jgi:hypothetical protein
LVPKAAIVPIAIQYVWGEQPAPAAWGHLGTPIPAADADAARLERAVEDGLARIDAAVAGSERAFPALVAPRVKSPERGVGARLLGGRKGDHG